MKWRPIESAPRDKKTYVIVYDPSADYEDEKIKIDRWDYNGRDENDNPVYGWDGAPTHWMPLPEPPSE